MSIGNDITLCPLCHGAGDDDCPLCKGEGIVLTWQVDEYMRKERKSKMDDAIPLWKMKSKLYLTDRQIMWLSIMFPVSAIIGPVGILINVFIYLVIAVCIFRGIV